MPEPEETIKKISLEEILNAVNRVGETIKETNARLDKLDSKVDKLEIRLDKFERSTDLQFEAIREGIVHNSSSFDRLEAVVYNSRGDISNLRADVKLLTEEVYQIRKANLVSLEK